LSRTRSTLSFAPGLQFTQTFPVDAFASTLLNLLIVHLLLVAFCVAMASIVFLH